MQHDAQEFLGWLLDSIHEDLNRVKVKPYVEYPDDEEASLLSSTGLAERYWECHLLRNQSVIVDLFHGLLRSNLSCHECKSRKTKFEPFTNLELPLPLDQQLYVSVVFHWLDGRKVPEEIGVYMETRRRTINDLKTLISQKVGVDRKRFVLFTVESSNIGQFFSTRRKLKDLTDIERMHGMEVSLAPELAAQAHCQPKEQKDQAVEQKEGKKEKRSKQKKKRKAESKVGEEGDGGSKDRLEDQEQGDKEEKEEEEEIEQHEEKESNGEATQPSCSSLFGEGVKRESEDFVVVAAINRYLRYNPEYVALPFEVVVFGEPIVVALSVCGDNVIERIYDHVGMVLGDSIVKGDHGSDDRRWPFVIKLVSNSGMHCRVCPWTSRCLGCELDEENISRLTPKFTIALDWDRETLSNCYDSARAKLTHVDNSLHEMRRVRAQPLELSVCLDMFSDVEQLSKADSWCVISYSLFLVSL